MTAKEIFTQMKHNAAEELAYYIGFISKKKYTMILNMVEQFKVYAETDKELGILKENEFKKEMNKYHFLKKSLETAEF